MSGQQEELTIWFINLLAPYARIFETMYGIKFKITDTIILKQSEPKVWYYMDNKLNIKTHDEEWLKWRIIGYYLKSPTINEKQISEIIQQDTYDYQEKQDYEGLSFYFEQKLSQGKIYRPVTYQVAQELFKNPNEKNEILNNCTKILGCRNLNRGKLLFSITYDRASPKCQPRYYFSRKRIAKEPMEKEEFAKQEGNNNIKKKVVQLQEEYDKSVASNQNSTCEHFVQSMCRFIEGKLQKIVSSLDVEFFVTDHDLQIYLTGLDSLYCFNNEGVPEPLDLANLVIQKKKQQNFEKCAGIYCQYAQNNIFYDENDEQFSVFIMQNEKGFKKLTYKSIFLDVIERYKTIEMIRQQASAKIQGQIPEQLIFKFRRFYSLGDVTHSSLFKHLKIANFYKEQQVCYYCYVLYTKLDNQRNKFFSTPNQDRQMIPQEQMLNDIDKFYTQPTQVKLFSKVDENPQFSKFFEKLKQFDTEQLKFFEEFTLTYSQDDKFFNGKKAKHFMHSSNKQFELPNIMKVELKSKNNMIKKTKYVIPKEQIEQLGLKHYLGHARNLPYSDQGLAISKSSLELNKLQDKIREIQRIKERMDAQKIKKVREDIEIMMCTYYGKNKFETERLIDFIETMKLRNQDQESDDQNVEEPQIQIVTDKNDFLSENQRKIKLDKEKQELEIMQTKKDFLELNSDLAQSVQKRVYQERYVNRWDYSSDKNSEY